MEQQPENVGEKLNASHEAADQTYIGQIKIIADSLAISAPNRGDSWCDVLRKRYSDLVISVDSDWQRTTSYLKNLHLEKKYHMVIIQLGICDCAPRCIPYIKKDLHLIKEFLSGLSFDTSTLNDLDITRKFISINRIEILKRIEDSNSAKRTWLNPEESYNNVAAFTENNRERFENLLYVLPIKPLKEDLKLYHYKANELIDAFISSLKKSQGDNVYFLDLNENKNFVKNKERYMIPYDYELEDGYHLNQDGNYFLADEVSEIIRTGKPRVKS